MTSDPVQPPPLVEPPPAPPPEALLADAQRTLRTPALLLMGSAALNGIVMALIAFAAAAGAIAVVARSSASAASNGAELVWVVPLGLISLVHFGFVLGEMVVGYSGLRMLRTHGWRWAVTGPIVHVVLSLVHSTVLFMVVSVLACLVVPVELGLAVVIAIVVLVKLADPRVRTAFHVVEADPSLLDALRDRAE